MTGPYADDAIFARQSFGQPVGWGRAPALVVVDFVEGFRDPAAFGGGNIDAAVQRTAGLAAAFRQAGAPVVLTRIVYAADGSDHGMFVRKAPNLARLAADSPLNAYCPELQRTAGDILIDKRQPSAFFATDLAGILVARGVDTVVLAGATTSGCVRATAVDGMSHNFRVIVATDCIGDRSRDAHAASLYDIGQKYGDLSTADAVEGQLAAMTCRPAAGD
jgi:maleamate amidohydrolase